MRYKVLTISFLLCAILASATVGTLSSYSMASSCGEVGVKPDTNKINQLHKEYEEQLEQERLEQERLEQERLEQEQLEQEKKDQGKKGEKMDADLMNQAEVDIESNFDPEQSLEPDIGALPDGVDVLGGITVDNSSDVSNEDGFVVLAGDVTQADEDASLEFGGNAANAEDETDGGSAEDDAYVLYFEPGTEVRFADGTSADMSGFYKISSGEEKADLFDKSLYEETEDGYQVKEDNGKLEICTDVKETCDDMEIPLKIKD